MCLHCPIYHYCITSCEKASKKREAKIRELRKLSAVSKNHENDDDEVPKLSDKDDRVDEENDGWDD
jgi:hypothetical protein